MGIRPNAALGQGIGELAAAQAAGMFDLEEGLRLAAVPGGASEPAERHLIGGALPLISATTGHVVDSETSIAPDRWSLPVAQPIASGPCLKTLADLEIEAIVEIAPAAAPVVAVPGRGIPVVTVGGAADGSFVAAVAAAYEGGLPISFAGLFAGETRHRISLPSYPFQRRRHWIGTRKPGI